MLRTLALLLLLLSASPARGDPVPQVEAVGGEQVPVVFRTEPQGAEVWLEVEGRDPVSLGRSGDKPVPVPLELFQGQAKVRLRYRLEGHMPALDTIRPVEVTTLAAEAASSRQAAAHWPRAEPRRLIPSRTEITLHTSPQHARLNIAGQDALSDEPIIVDRSLFADPVTGVDQPFDVDIELEGHLPATIQVNPQVWYRREWPPDKGVVKLQAKNWEVAVRYWIKDHPGPFLLLTLCLLVMAGLGGVTFGQRRTQREESQARRQKIQDLLRQAESGDDPFLGETFGPYRLVERLTEDYGYRALPDSTMDDSGAVFVKVFSLESEDSRRSFETRIDQMRAALDHPSVVRLIDWGEEDELIFLVTELAEGKPLEPPREPMPAEAVVRLMRPVLESLAHAHHQGVVHRRLSPDKILLGSTGKAKLAGFEPAEADEREEAYRSPEEREGKRPTSKSDQYSVGAVFYRLLTGAPPGPRPRNLLSLPSIPRKIGGTIMRLLEEQPSSRFRNLAEALAELDEATRPKEGSEGTLDGKR